MGRRSSLFAVPPSLMAAIFKIVRKPEMWERLVGDLVVSTECLCWTGYYPVESTKSGLISLFAPNHSGVKFLREGGADSNG
jgi:hypothetical protein